MSPGHRLGIDFGTSHTVGIVAWPDDRVRPLLFDGSPLLPSAVCAEPGEQPGAAGPLLVGRDAVHAARLEPARFEGTPKRRIDDGTVLLGDAEYPVATLIGAVLARVAEEATRVIGGPPAEVVLSHPAAWGVSRRLTLLEAAKAAGLGEPSLVPEPVAAAKYFAALTGERFEPGHGVLVYDFGGGTFDASLVVRTPEGYDVRAVDGIDDLGGLDLDELVVGHTGQRLGAEHAGAWQRLSNPATAEDRRHRRMLWDDARIVKERLSRAASTTLHIPVTGTDVVISRAAFEDMARPMIERTARTTAAVLRWSGLPKEQLAGVFLVGGSSRIPLVATVLQRELGIAPTVLEQPELVVAEGALRPGGGAAAPGRPVAVPPITPPAVPPVGAVPVSGPPAAAAPVSPSPVSAAPVSAVPVSAAPVSSAPVSSVPALPGQVDTAALAAGHASAGHASAGQMSAGQVSAAPVSATPGSVAPVSAAPGTAAPVSAAPGGTAPGGVAPMSAAPMSAPPVSPAPMAVEPATAETTEPLPQFLTQRAVGPVRSAGGYQPAQPYPQPAAYQAQPYLPAQYQPPHGPAQQHQGPAQPPQGYWQPGGYQAAPQRVGEAPGRDAPPRGRRAWWPPFLAGLFVLALVTAGYALRDSLRSIGGGDEHVGSTTSATAQPAYQRAGRPEWLPADWQPTVQQAAEQMWYNSDEKDNSRCVTSGDTLRVTRRDAADIVGCSVQPPLGRTYYDVAVEVQVTVETGCAGVWARTGGKGYVLAVCRDWVDLLHVEGKEQTQLGSWRIGYQPHDAVVGLLVRGDQISAYVSGQQVGATVTDPNVIRYGKVNAGGWPNSHRQDGGIDATFSDLRIFAPPGSPSAPPAQQSTPPAPSKSPSKSPSWRPSTSTNASTSRSASPTR